MATAANSSAKKTSSTAKKNAGTRINFSDKVARDIAFEAHLFCSNPTCCRLTSYATTSGKARSIAEAAHVNAASKGGPRAGDGLKPDQLKSAANGIWLCRICHGRIDADPDAYPDSMLLKWKRKHAAFVSELVGKDFDAVLFRLHSRTRNVAECIAFLSYVEDRRFIFDGLDAEWPHAVLASLIEFRVQVRTTRSFIREGDPAYKELGALQTAIHNFLSANPGLETLKCDGNDPVFVRFLQSLKQLRVELLPHVLTMAAAVEHTMSDAILAKARDLRVPVSQGGIVAAAIGS